jgi:hypothetical protein
MGKLRGRSTDGQYRIRLQVLTIQFGSLTRKAGLLS